MINLLIVEDQAIVLSALSALLSLESDFNVCATAQNGCEALKLCHLHSIDVVITDIEMPEMDGLMLAEQLSQQWPEIQVIVLTTFSKAGYIHRSQAAHVSGYLLKDSPSELLVGAVRKVLMGEVVIAPELLSQVWRVNIAPLSDKERRILQLAQQGKSSKEMAEQLHLSYGTVRNYSHNACQKLQAKNRVEAVVIAERMGWL